MKYYLDTEFIEGEQDKRFLGFKYGETPPTIDLISIGIVAEDGGEYYAISKDFNLKEAWNRYQMKETSPAKKYMGFYEEKEYWIRENVLRPIFNELNEKDLKGQVLCLKEFGYPIAKGIPLSKTKFTFKRFQFLVNKYGKTNEKIAKEIREFVAYNEEPELHLQDLYNPKFKSNNVIFYAYYADYDWVVFCQLFGTMNDLPSGFPMYCTDLKQILDEKVTNVFIDNGKGENLKEGRLDWIKTLPHCPKQENEHNALADAKWNKKLHNFLNSL